MYLWGFCGLLERNETPTTSSEWTKSMTRHQRINLNGWYADPDSKSPIWSREFVWTCKTSWCFISVNRTWAPASICMVLGPWRYAHSNVNWQVWQRSSQVAQEGTRPVVKGSAKFLFDLKLMASRTALGKSHMFRILGEWTQSIHRKILSLVRDHHSITCCYMKVHELVIMTGMTEHWLIEPWFSSCPTLISRQCF